MFHFTVEWGGESVSFSEVSGLNIESQVIEYRDGANPEFTAQKMPGLQKYGNITLKRGVVDGDNQFYEWLNTTNLNKVERRDLIINLLNEEHEPVMSWKVKNAFPVKVDGPGLKATGNEVAIESLEIAHEGLTIQNE
ncbi:MAG: phage tail protein [Balneolaceae bacterium]|nr:phage tail protein [Balneolaceae bacterium]